MTKDANNPNNPFTTYEWRHTVIPVDQLDPRIIDLLPPELRKAVEKEVGIGNQQTTEEEPVQKEKIKFDYKMVNCNQDLKELTTKLKKSKIKQYGILLYGVSGAGKSFYGQWLAQELKMPVIKKRASDLNDKFVGQTEQNIRKAFQEAKEKKAILIIDEADSMLYDRRFSTQMYQATAVNEVLTQMEDHPYPFIMTSNLKDKIDTAALRRFVFKIKYDYMKPENVQAGVKTYFGKEFKLSKEQLDRLKYICSGDFKVAKAKVDILENGECTNDMIFKYLLKEQEEKEIKQGSNKINF